MQGDNLCFTCTHPVTDKEKEDELNNKYPKLKNFYDIIKHANELIIAVEQNPGEDIVYKFSTLFNCCRVPSEDGKIFKHDTFPESFTNPEWGWVVAGSKGVEVCSKYLREALQRSNNKKWDPAALRDLTGMTVTNEFEAIFIQKNLDTLKLSEEVKTQVRNLGITPVSRIHGDVQATDTDIFFLNSPVPHRMVIGQVDLVHSCAASVEDLLLNFDLPCCRAGFNSRNDFWISAQCIYTLLTGKYFLPSYLKDLKKFTDLVSIYRGGDPMKVPEQWLFNRIHERIKKYEKRGFNCEWIEVDTVLPWIRNRFHYGEWLSQTSKVKA